MSLASKQKSCQNKMKALVIIFLIKLVVFTSIKQDKETQKNKMINHRKKIKKIIREIDN